MVALNGIFAQSQHILELGCGTGEDALRLARAGIKVTATDASAEMIKVAVAKMRRLTDVEPVEFHCVPMEAIAVSLKARSFDGVFSNFGAMNCVSDLPSLATGLAGILKPGAPLLWVIMGRRVPWEWMWYLLRGEMRRALRRFQRNGVEWRRFDYLVPNARRSEQRSSPTSQVRRVSPLGCVLPPSLCGCMV